MYELKTIILNISEPILIKNRLKWDMLSWNLEKWTEMLGVENLNFRLGVNEFTAKPQFENTTKSVQMTFKEFLEYQQVNPQKWLYFDYKYLQDWFKDMHELRKQINWSDFGFSDLSANDSTIWIGSKGAHTPCHADTYGCNIVAQVYGRKKWILFPPNENLLPSRVPYEESSIYSQLNFFTPSVDKFKDINRCRTVILEPGDVLILPHKWWHYVENLDLAISINTWITLPIDHEERVNESIVQTLMFQLTNALSQEVREKVLNPELQELSKCNLIESVDIIKAALNLRNLAINETSSININLKDVLEQYSTICQTDEMAAEQFKNLLSLQSQRFESADISLVNEDDKDIVKVINSILHPDVIDLIKFKLLEN